MHITSSRILTSTALVTVFCAQSAWADITPRDVWDSWRDYTVGFGYDISASEKTDGDTLTVENLVMSMQIPEEDGSMSIDMGTVRFEAVGDGTVSIILPEKTPYLVNIDADGEEVELTLDMKAVGMNTIVSGTPDAMVYDYSAAQLALDLVKIIVDGEEIPDIVAGMAMTGLKGTSETIFGDLLTSKQSGSLDGLKFTAKGVDPDSGEAFDVSVGATGMQVEAIADVPTGEYEDDPAAFFADGFDLEGSYTIQSSEMTVNFDEGDGPGVINFTSGAGVVGINMNGEAMMYDGTLTKASLNAAGADIPVPVDVSFGELGYGFSMPLAASEEKQEFGLSLKLLDLAVSELLWGMFDPGQVLPRDPANLIIDVSGMGTLFTDIMTLDEDSDDIPGELNALTIKDVQLNAAGASVSGAGSFVFDNSDLESFDGLPRPEGSVDINIAGINGLMDKLIQMGLLPEEQAMGARMMMSMFTQPGAGDDTLTSKIEINEQGQVLANGQRLK